MRCNSSQTSVFLHKLRQKFVDNLWTLFDRILFGPYRTIEIRLRSRETLGSFIYADLKALKSGGQEWIRTTEGVSQRIYSP